MCNLSRLLSFFLVFTRRAHFVYMSCTYSTYVCSFAFRFGLLCAPEFAPFHRCSSWPLGIFCERPVLFRHLIPTHRKYCNAPLSEVHLLCCIHISYSNSHHRSVYPPSVTTTCPQFLLIYTAFIHLSLYCSSYSSHNPTSRRSRCSV